MATKKHSNTRKGSRDERLEEEVANFPAAINDATMYRLEEAAQSPGYGQARRLALAALTRSADQLSDFSVKEPKAYGEQRKMVDEYKEYLEGLLRAVVAASLRLNIADCREVSHG